MKYLLWDERRAGMLACRWFATCFAGLTQDTQDKARALNMVMENT